jgi:multidrug resistance protein, MATE family
MSSIDYKELDADGGYRHVLRLALPLIVSTSSSTVMQFVDRVFLGWHSTVSLGAAMGGAFPVWTLTSLFVGTASYTSTFVAQYYGAGRRQGVANSIWQGLLFASFAWIALIVAGAFAPEIISVMKHAPEVMEQETIYFRILVLGAGLQVFSAVLSSFYSGIGRTRTIMIIETLGNVVNFFLAYTLILGRWGMPRLGIRGAGIATVSAWAFVAITYVCMARFGPLGKSYRLLRRPRVDAALLWRIVRYGVPSGMQWTADVAGWWIFFALVGQLGVTQLAAVSAAFTINALAFQPMIGLGIATSIIVGQSVTAGRISAAERATKRAFTLTFVYMATISALYIVLPRTLIRLFSPETDAAQFAAVVAYSVVLLRFVALYSLFDGMNIIYAGAIRGAGDTRFVLLMVVGLSTSLLIVPTYLIIEVFRLGVYAAMTAATAYVIVIALCFYARYKGGKWKSMRVIEAAVPPIELS